MNTPKVAKIVLLGPSKVGKTSLATKFGLNNFNKNQTSTIGVAFLTKTYYFEKGIINFELWDTAGQEIYKSITMSYIRNAKAILCVYDLSKKDTISSAIDYALDSINILDENTIIAMIGNKSDLCKDVPPEIYSFVEKYSYLHFECSAFTGEGIDEIFHSIGLELFKKKFFQNSIVSSIPVISIENSKNCC